MTPPRILFRPLLGFVAALMLAAASLAATARPEAGRYLRAASFDLRKILPDAPADDSLATRADLEVVLQVQARRTPDQIAVATQFEVLTVFDFDTVLGAWFGVANLPFTAGFFDQVNADRAAVSNLGKAIWNRPRPPLLDPRIKPAAAFTTSGSYPSGHATQAFVQAGLLAAAFPEKREALREHARLIAWSRVIGGVHYPSDIVAGQILGDRLVEEFLQVPAVREALDRVRAEAVPFLQPAAK